MPPDTGFDGTVHSVLEIRIKASKTSPFRKGVSLYLGRTYADLCPLAAVLNYVERWGLSPGPFLTFSNGRLLTRERFVAGVRSALQVAGISSSHYAGHSF